MTDGPIVTIHVTSHKNAKRHGLSRPYLARLHLGERGSVGRAFAPRVKAGRNEQRFVANGCAGDIFEARRWLWDAERRNYAGGTVYFGVQSDGSLFPLSRDEAFASLVTSRVEAWSKDGSTSGRAVELPAAQRMLPEDVWVHRIE